MIKRLWSCSRVSAPVACRLALGRVAPENVSTKNEGSPALGHPGPILLENNEIELVHVRSHTKVPGNEIADWLAERGSSGTLSGATRAAAEWADRWMREHGSASETGEGGSGGARAGASHLAPGGLGDPRGEG